MVGWGVVGPLAHSRTATMGEENTNRISDNIYLIGRLLLTGWDDVVDDEQANDLADMAYEIRFAVAEW